MVWTRLLNSVQALFWQDNKKPCSERRKWRFLTSKHSTEYFWTKELRLTEELKKVVEKNENSLLEKWNFCPPKPVLSNA